jgi:hypothetical protein
MAQRAPIFLHGSLASLHGLVDTEGTIGNGGNRAAEEKQSSKAGSE